jgi:long-chain acyl-CoA synthetase
MGDGMGTLPALLERNSKLYGQKEAFREKQFGIWQTWSWSEVHEEVNKLSLGLISLGVKEGDHICVIGRNRPQLYWSILAAQNVGAIPTPLYQDSVATEMVYPISHCNAPFAIVEDQEQVDKLIEISDQIHELKGIVYLDSRGLRNYENKNLFSLSDVATLDRDKETSLRKELEKRKSKQGLDTKCILIYTSGTTGRSKGVVLCNKNVLESGKAGIEFDNIDENFSLICYLPMAWVGDFAFTMGLGLQSGMCLCCPESAETLQEDLREIGPSYFFGPPRFFESLLTSVNLKIDDAGSFKKSLYKYFMAIAKLNGEKILENKSVGLVNRIKYFLGDIFVYGPLKNRMGFSNTKVGYTAGEAIGPEIFQFYRSLGVNLKQLYGQTEACVFVTCQPNGQVFSETVGVPVSGVELKISNAGEVFYRSPGSFLEYFKDPVNTKKTKDKSGWVATGDAGFIEEETGHLRIIDRAKDVGKTKHGGMFAPKYVENKLKFYPNILEAVLFGADEEFCVALINIDLTAVGNWAEKKNISYASYQELAGNSEVYQIIAGHIMEVNKSLAVDKNLAGCQIHRFLVLHKELDPDDGEITRTRKVRRNLVSEKYADLISALYTGKKTVFTETEVTYEDGRKGKISANIMIQDIDVPISQDPVA